MSEQMVVCVEWRDGERKVFVEHLPPSVWFDPALLKQVDPSVVAIEGNPDDGYEVVMTFNNGVATYTLTDDLTENAWTLGLLKTWEPS